ncbi:MAG TPA: hypothetical protein VHX63_02040 [Acidobacteriaceae bacterium]|nr:hypothetical protein [Acidobacteriaceae bacterium]
MTNPNRFLRTILFVLLAAACFVALPPSSRAIFASPLQDNGPQQGSGFLGAWCAQGNPNKHASVTSNGGGFLNLTNENGDTAAGALLSPTQVSAPQWQFVTGTLSGDGSQISWSNGTFWARCYNGGGGGGGHHRINLTGTWFAGGNRSKSCSIQQHHGNLSLQNEAGQGASGSFTDRRHITTNWNGANIGGTITNNGNRINWDNGTYWIRNVLYTQ